MILEVAEGPSSRAGTSGRCICFEKKLLRFQLVFCMVLLASCCSMVLKFLAIGAHQAQQLHAGWTSTAPAAPARWTSTAPAASARWTSMAPAASVADVGEVDEALDTVPHIVRDRSSYAGRSLPNAKIFLTGDLVYDQINRQNTRLLQRSVAMLHVDGGMMDERARSIDRSLVQAGLVGAWEAYQALHAPPYRDELFRYMALWSEGGIYMDGRLLLRGPVELWASLDEGQTLSICSDRNRTFTSQRTGEEVPVLWNGAFSAKKNSPVLLESIRRIVETVRQRSYYLDGEEEAIGNLTHRAAGVTGSLVLSLVSLRLRDQVRIPCIYKGPRHGIFEPEDQGTQWRGRSWDRQLGEFEPHLFRRQKKKGRDYGWWFEEGLLYAGNPDDASERDGGKGP